MPAGAAKAGGVKLARNPEEAEQKAREMIGKNLVTHQTGPEGRQVRRVLVEQGLNIDRELYLALVLDRAAVASFDDLFFRRRRRDRRSCRKTS